MTFKYRQVLGDGEALTRISRVVIENPYNGTPSMHAVEETILNISGEEHKISLGASLSATFSPSTQFPLRHPDTDELIGGTGSHQDIQLYLYSALRAMQIERDGGELL
jgi:hypothetical protein